MISLESFVQTTQNIEFSVSKGQMEGSNLAWLGLAAFHFEGLVVKGWRVGKKWCLEDAHQGERHNIETFLGHQSCSFDLVLPEESRP